MAYPMLKASSTWFQSTTMTRPDFTIIRVVDSYEPTGAETESWAADVDGNGDITCYVVGTELIIAGNGSGMISLNEDSSYVFSVSGVNTTSVPSFLNVTHFYGGDLLDTSGVTNFERAFAYAMGLEYIDVSKWDTGNVTNMKYMFGAAGSVLGNTGKMVIKALDVSNWNVGAVTSFDSTFLCCKELEFLDTRNWNMQAVTTIKNMCQGCSKLEHIYTENWVTPRLSIMAGAFKGCGKLKELNFKSLNNQGVSSSNKSGVFLDCTELERVTVGSNFNFPETTVEGGRPANPSSEYIDGADGRWHTLRGDSYDASEMPSGINITYYASPLLVEEVLKVPVILDGETAVDIANAVREVTGGNGDLMPNEWAAALRNKEG